LDIDGTILDINGQVPPRTRAAVVAAAQAGVQVVLATGRGIEAALPVADFLGLTRGWMVCANGALTVRLDPKLKGTASLPGGYEITNSVTFDPTTAIGRLHQVLPEAIFAVEMPGRGFLTSADFPPGELIENTTTVSLEQLSSQPVSRVIVRAPGMALADFEVAVRSAGLHAVEYAIGWTAWLDVNAAGVSKASALDALVSGLGVKHTVAMGDGANDLEMLRWADLSVAMGSAPARVKNATSVVTEPVWHEGAAIVLAALSR
jgi:HAD-superfamily hydrolase, subfamily IIB